MLSQKQKEVLDYINDYQKTEKHGPTLDEIASFFKRTIPTIHQHVEALRRKGYLKLPSTMARSIAVFNPHEEVVQIPLLGIVSAGGGIENIESPEPIKVQRSLLSPTGQHFALTIRGTSMVDDGIMPDDIVLVRQQNYVDNGDVVVALVQNESGETLATIKRYYNQGDTIELRPKNPNLTSKFYKHGDLEVRGKFVGLIRQG